MRLRVLLVFALVFLLVPTSAGAFTWLDADTTPPTITIGGPTTVEAASPSGTTVDYHPSVTDDTDPSPSLTCTPAAGTSFALGVTAVHCDAQDASGNTAAADFNVTVQDTTAPVLGALPAPVPVEATSPAGTTVSYSLPTATDNGDASPTVGCSPGNPYPVGNTPVTCTATDASGNSSSGSFTVTVTDTTKPTLANVPSSVSREATSPSGTVVTYSLPTATDNGDPSPSVNCTPASGTAFALGINNVTCTAQDNSGNTQSASFTITIVDTTNPVIVGLPTSFSLEATSGSGAVVNYTVPTATDNADPAPTVNCLPASGSTFAVGATPVACTAHDNSGHSAVGSFTITVTDHTGPVISGYANKTVEANGPTGSFVNYPAPSATDAVDGPIASVPCVPASSTKFALGTTTVHCSATDSHGNTTLATFNVRVVDTTPPNLIVPIARSVYATTPTGIPTIVSSVFSFLSAASATDIVDSSPVVTNNAPSFLPVGNLTITFGARDFSGNATFKDVTLIVLPQPPPGTPPLPIPPPPKIPAEPTNVTVTPLDGAARIRWNAGGREVMVTRSSSSTRSLSAIGDQQVVYTGTGSSYTDRGLTNGVEYRYVVEAVDAAGNHSVGVAAVIVPRRNLLKSPKDGAKLRKAPKLIWVVDAEAQYYNAQLLLNGKKVLSAWPVRPAYALKKSWKFEGRKYTLKPGVYTWFVWPGYGPRSDVNYGNLMGSRTFQIVR